METDRTRVQVHFAILTADWLTGYGMYLINVSGGQGFSSLFYLYYNIINLLVFYRLLIGYSYLPIEQQL